MKKEGITVKWRAGLHARPASDIVKTANKFNSKITIQKENVEVDGKSVIGMMTLGAAYKTNLIVIVDGDDEDIALQAILDLFNNEESEDY